MSGLSKRDAAKLVERIRAANVSGHTIAVRTGGGSHAAMAGFLGGLESVLVHFLLMQGCAEASAALARAMNEAPTATEIEAQNAQIDSFRRAPAGSAA